MLIGSRKIEKAKSFCAYTYGTYFLRKLNKAEIKLILSSHEEGDTLGLNFSKKSTAKLNRQMIYLVPNPKFVNTLRILSIWYMVSQENNM